MLSDHKSINNLRQHYAESALRYYDSKTVLQDEYKNNSMMKPHNNNNNNKEYSLNHSTIGGAEALKYYGRLNKAALRQRKISD